MFLTNLYVANYRNITEVSVQFSEKITWIIGANGAGKTNLLDSIYYLAFCKSSFALNDGQNIRRSADGYFSIKGVIRREAEINTVFCALNDKKQKVIKVDDVVTAKLAEHIGVFPMVLVSPSDQNLIIGGAEERRRFLDLCISQIDTNYLKCLLIYNSLLEQRNKCLKNAVPDITLIEVLNLQMQDVADYIYNKRKFTVELLLPLFQKFYERIADKEQVHLVYQSQLHEASLNQLLLQSYSKDCALQYTSCGTHRDDLQIEIDSVSARHNGSQGQKKSITLALRMAQYQITKSVKQFSPVFLLDDLFDKLDSQRTARLVELLHEDDFGQVIITDTDRSHAQIADTNPSVLFLLNGSLSVIE